MDKINIGLEELNSELIVHSDVNILNNFKLNNFYLIRKQNYVQTVTTRSDIVNEVLNLSYFRRSTIMSFFAENQVDVPLCFNKSSSLFFKSFELPHLKFSNLLMRRGNRSFISKVLTSILVHFTSQTSHTLKEVEPINLMSLMFLTKYDIRVFSNEVLNFSLYDFYALPNNKVIYFDNYKVKSNTFMLDKVINYFNVYSPLFGFYVRKVDKSVRKHSRGKSGKYSLL